ncbi:MAG TPA: CU044_5270 family protein, partial [Actinomycetota bacterium]|nr:CU044_5270 family protein [Actinomycetota bacterium]
MNRIDNDVMRITRSANPVPDEVVGGSVQGDEAQDLLARIAQPPTPEPRPGNWIRFGIPAAVSMAVVIALLSVSLVRGGPGLPGITSPGGPETSAGSPVVLERIAAVAAMQPEITLPPGGFRYTKSEARYMSTTIHSQDNSYSVLESTIREIWVAEDGEGRLRTEVGDVEFLTDRDRRAWEAAGSPPLRRDTVSDDRFPGGDPGGTDLYFENFDGLSTDPDEVYRVVEERSRNQGITLHQEMFDMVGALLRETNAPPEIRSALFRAAAKIPGMEVKEN